MWTKVLGCEEKGRFFGGLGRSSWLVGFMHNISFCFSLIFGELKSKLSLKMSTQQSKTSLPPANRTVRFLLCSGHVCEVKVLRGEVWGWD